MHDHPSEEQLAEYALDPSLTDAAEELAAHLDRCGPCRERLADIRSFDGLLVEEESWRGIEELGRTPTAPPALSAAAARNAREDAEADARLSQLIDTFVAGSSGAFVWADIGSRPEYYTAGVVRKLAAAADIAQYSVPRRALILAETASVIVGMLSTDTYTPTELAALRGVAWKQRANANRQLGQFQDALNALACAERAYRELPRPELDLASITFIRATIYHEQQRYDLAEQYAEESTVAFAQLGQTEFHLRSRHLQGCIAFEQREVGKAQEIFDTIFAHGEATGDLTWIARESQVLGHCYLERREIMRASQFFYQGMLAFGELGMLLPKIRCRWGLALAVQRDGRYRAAIPQLRDVREEFVRLGAVTDAALVTLDLMETFLLLGKPRDVRRTAGNVVRLFREAGMVTGALTAADYLKQAAAVQTVTPSLIDYVRRYLRAAELQPDLAFVPPSSL